MKLHVGCGSVYLRPSVRDDPNDGWMNVDMLRKGCHTVQESPNLVRRLSATEDDYYANTDGRSVDDFERGPMDGTAVVDAYGSFQNLPCGQNEATEVLSRQVWEHMTLNECRQALVECDRVLKSGGLLRIDVPDIEQSLEEYHATGRPFYRRHVLGSRKDAWSYHLSHFSREGLIEICDDYGFVFETEEPNIHCYPAYCLRFRKAGLRGPAWTYADLRDGDWRELGRQEGKSLEIGPGDNPWPFADAYADVKQEVAEAAGQKFQKPWHVCNLGSATPLPFADKEFDFIYCAHVLEHVADPVFAANELSRVAESGVIVCPSALTEGMFAFHEDSHLWLVYMMGDSGIVRFQSNERIREKIRDPNVNAVAHRLYRLGPARFDADSVTVRKWFHRVEPWLSVIHRWKEKLEVEVVD